MDESSARKPRSNSGSKRFQIAVHVWLKGLAHPVYNRSIPAANNATPSTIDVDELTDALVFGKGSRMPRLSVKQRPPASSTSSPTQRDYMPHTVSLNVRFLKCNWQARHGHYRRVDAGSRAPATGAKRRVQNCPVSEMLDIIVLYLVAG